MSKNQKTTKSKPDNIPGSAPESETYIAVLICHGKQTADECWDAINEIAPDLVERVCWEQNPETGAEQVVFYYGSDYLIDDWHFADPSVALPERQGDEDPVLELIASERVDSRLVETEGWSHVYGVPYESLTCLNCDEIDRLYEIVDRVFYLHFPEVDQAAEEIPLEDDASTSDDSSTPTPVTADWLFKNFRDTIVDLQVTDQQRVNLFQPIFVALLCDGFSDESCRDEYIKWLKGFLSKFERN